MSEFKTAGAELKKLVKLARNKALSFAFCPATDADALFSLHRRKKPAILGKILRKESKQTKVAFGTVTAEGKTLTLACEKLVPGLAKKLKKYFRLQKLSLKVTVLDAGGQEVAG